MPYLQKNRKHGNRWHPESCVDKQLIRSLYISGLSTRQISSKIGISKSYIHEICEGLTRGRQEAAVLRQPPTSKHWRSSRAAARKKVERNIGRKLLNYEHVHHIDGDYTNNELDNLEILSQEEHTKEHLFRRPCVVYFITCAWCGTVVCRRRNRNIFCSSSCANKRRA